VRGDGLPEHVEARAHAAPGHAWPQVRGRLHAELVGEREVGGVPACGRVDERAIEVDEQRRDVRTDGDAHAAWLTR